MDEIQSKNSEMSSKKLDILRIFFYFLICAFIGWVFETVAVFIETGKLTDRGFLFIMNKISDYLPFLSKVPLLHKMRFVWGLPIIEIYGFGGVIIIGFFKKLENHPFKLFIIGMICLSFLELLGSYFCTNVLHHSYWNYTADFLNFQGRICLRSAISWGILSITTIKWIKPQLDHLYLQFEKAKKSKIIIVALMIYTLICGLVKYVIDPSIISN